MERSKLESGKILQYLDIEDYIKQTKDISFEEEGLQQDESELIRILSKISTIQLCS